MRSLALFFLLCILILFTGQAQEADTTSGIEFAHKEYPEEVFYFEEGKQKKFKVRLMNDQVIWSYNFECKGDSALIIENETVMLKDIRSFYFKTGHGEKAGIVFGALLLANTIALSAYPSGILILTELTFLGLTVSFASVKKAFNRNIWDFKIITN